MVRIRVVLVLLAAAAMTSELLLSTHAVNGLTPAPFLQADDTDQAIRQFVPAPSAALPENPVIDAVITSNCRFGASQTSGLADPAGWLSSLGASWYVDFAAHQPAAGTSAEYVQILRVHQNKNGCNYLSGYTSTPALTESGLGAVIKSAPGALWIIGNEPDRGPNPGNCTGGQDDTFPEIYAQAYHDAYVFIKAHDPTARVANAGLVEVTPGRLQYLDKVWQAYLGKYGTLMPVDVWNMHLYVLPEALPNGQPNGIANVALGTDAVLAIRESGNNPANCPDPKVYCWAEHDDMTAFSEQIVAMRTWMKQHGQQDKPLILSEYSQLYPFLDYDDPVNPTTCYLQDEFGGCFTPNRVSSFMTRSFDYLGSAADMALGYPLDEYRLVQRWLWFSMYWSDQGFVSNLVTPTLPGLTQQGQLFKDSVISRSAQVNLRPDNIPQVSISAPSGSGSAIITVHIYNTGTFSNASAFEVTLYSDSALTQPAGSASVATGPEGCAWRDAKATITWPGLSWGSHPFWIRVDSGNAVTESDETDNVTSSVVWVYPYGMLAPIIARQ
jgi:hypothetical protein